MELVQKLYFVKRVKWGEFNLMHQIQMHSTFQEIVGCEWKIKSEVDVKSAPIQMTRVDVASSSDTNHQDWNKQEWIRAITHDDDDTIRFMMKRVSTDSHFGDLLNVQLQLEQQHTEHNCHVNHISATVYSPETSWSLAAMFNSRKVMKVLAEHGMNCQQSTSTGNNMLHVLVAFASTGGELQEERALKTIAYIKDLVGDDGYGKLLLAENCDGLRPLELACHLDTFGLFMYFFETPGIYVTQEEDHILYKQQFFDVTEYVTGARYLKSPIYSMAYMDESKLTNKYVKDAYLNEPMRSWSSIIMRVNLPCLFIWGFLRLVYIMLFLVCDLNLNGTCDVNSTCSNDKHINSLVNLSIHWVVLVASIFIILGDFYDFVYWLFYHPSWLYRQVYGRKAMDTHYIFYRIVHFSTVFVATVAITITLINYYTNINLSHAVEAAVLAVVFGFVWSVLYFLQIVPTFGYYVMALQRVLKDYFNFFVLLFVFFVIYAIGFFKLLGDNETMKDFKDMPSSLYSTFRVMLNMVEFYDPNDNVNFIAHVIHIAFVFMVPILLINFLIATFSSSYDHVMCYREVLFRMQCLSVSVRADQMFVRLLAPYRKYIWQKLFVNKNGRYYVTRVISQPVNPSQWNWCFICEICVKCFVICLTISVDLSEWFNMLIST